MCSQINKLLQVGTDTIYAVLLFNYSIQQGFIDELLHARLCGRHRGSSHEQVRPSPCAHEGYQFNVKDRQKEL